MLIAWSDDKAQMTEDSSSNRSQSLADCFVVPTFCELLPDIYRLFVIYSETSAAAPQFVHPDIDAPRFLGLGALLRLLRDASLLDNEVRKLIEQLAQARRISNVTARF